MELKTAFAVIDDLDMKKQNTQVSFSSTSQTDWIIKAHINDSDTLEFQIIRTYDPEKGIYLTPVYCKQEDGKWVEIPDMKTNHLSDDILAHIQSVKVKGRVKV